jgi:hypothetical protein
MTPTRIAEIAIQSFDMLAETPECAENPRKTCNKTIP